MTLDNNSLTYVVSLQEGENKKQTNKAKENKSCLYSCLEV